MNSVENKESKTSVAYCQSSILYKDNNFEGSEGRSTSRKGSGVKTAYEWMPEKGKNYCQGLYT